MNFRSVSAVAAGLVLALAPAASAFAAGNEIKINSATAGTEMFMNPIEVEVTYSCQPGTPSSMMHLSAASGDTEGIGRMAARCNGESITETIDVSPILNSQTNMLGSFSKGEEVVVDAAIVMIEPSAEQMDSARVVHTEQRLTIQ
ncbi:hypothetical protein AB0E21_19965 [Streptomyces sp. NPDC047967]|uniref:hypothetical protein n=1 Tax=Streptomyces sp. NPDC047967 TaxID=3154924 RepID=UPI00340AAB67